MTKLKNGAILLMLVTFCGCSNVNDKTVVLDATGKHSAGWVVANSGGKHPSSFLSAPDTCTECHGTDYKGGVTAVSCFSSDRNGISCHRQGPSGHPAGWNLATAHGAHAKAAIVGADGMAFCAHCHGPDYRGNGATQKDCFRCHKAAPHPDKPWFGGSYTHKNSDTSNAPACATCHTNRSNLSAAGVANLPGTAIIGTTGCFNNTLCHGQMGHPADWANNGHKSAAKAAAGATSGMDYCRNCHGTDFKGGTSGKSCFYCHAASPHAKPWLKSAGAAAYVHSTTEQTNATACGRCHGGGAKLTTPATPPANAGCFNNTLCHGAAGGHPAGWSASAVHGAAAKSLPDATHGFAYCITCHNTDYVSGPGTSCKKCHTAAPHPSSWRNAHRSTNQGNVSQCARCHLNKQRLPTPGNVPAGVTPGCFNSTLCHGSGD